MRLMDLTRLAVLPLLLPGALAHADALNELAGPRASKWGDSTDKVVRAEGRDPAASISADCLQFSGVTFEKGLYDISFGCYQPGRNVANDHPWTFGKKIATVSYSPTPFTAQPDPKEAFAWWEGELTQKYGTPALQLNIPLPVGQEAPLWTVWCPDGIRNISGWDNGDCAIPYRFTTYRRWTGKRTVIELYDRGAYMPGNPPQVVVAFTERRFFDAAEKAHMKGVAILKKKLQTQANARKEVPAF
jgi:hypothetical protein